MEFCDECGSMMKAEDGVWVCDEGHEKPRNVEAEAAMVTTEGQEQSEVVDMSDVDPQDRGLPTTEVHCHECGNDRAFYYMQQIRSADESETRFFICTECEHRWREDDH
jgi:DNA-directed RNA polymerase subunit M